MTQCIIVLDLRWFLNFETDFFNDSVKCVTLITTFFSFSQISMSVLGKETAVSTFAETQLVPIIACVEMDIIFIKMKKLAWVGSVFIFIKIRNLPWIVIIYSNLHLLSLAFTLSTKITITA